MKELDLILHTWRSGGPRIGEAVLATVVHVKGSAYRRPGARMLLLRDGTRIGGISGGCLEGDVVKKAWWLTENGHPVVRTYDTTSSDDAIWEFGLGCNGVVEVLLERLENSSATRALEFLARCHDDRHKGVMATVIRAADSPAGPSVGDRSFFGANGPDAGAQAFPSTFFDTICFQAKEVRASEKSRLVQLGGCDVFVEWIAPPQSLVIFGGGHDAIPLAKLAKELGWHVTVTDSRPAYVQEHRFPTADKVVLFHPRRPVSTVSIDKDSAVVVMTHNYQEDSQILRDVFCLNPDLHPRYLGILGPRSRTERLLREVGHSGHELNLHSPIGLDIGADSPEAIALSIVSEIQAVLANRSGGMLRHRSSAIYEPVMEVIA